MSDSFYNSSLILIIQSMQVTLVVIIILFSYNRRLSDQLSGAFETENKFYLIKNKTTFITIGFIINLGYLISNIGSKGTFNILFNTKNPQDISITILDLLTTIVFLQTLKYLLPGKNNKTFSGPMLIINFIAVAICCLSIFYNSFFSIFFDFAGYGIMAIYCFKAFKFPTKRTFSHIFIFSGFAIWSLLQLVPLFMHEESDTSFIEFVCYSSSAFAKALILLGFYNFSQSATDYYMEKEARQTKLLTSKVSRLNNLQHLINEVSNSTTTEILAGNIVKHFTDKRLFSFDYIILSKVDHLSRKILHQKSLPVSNKIKDIGDWVIKEGIPFGHHDIMAEVVRLRDLVYVRDCYINGVKQDLSHPQSKLNQKVFNQYGHKDLERIFIPVLNPERRIDADDTQNRVVAIIEAGYHKTTTYTTLMSELNKIELKIYLDNCSQTYEKLYYQEIERNISETLERCYEQSKDNHNEYIKQITAASCNISNADYGIFVLLSTIKPKDYSLIIPDDTIPPKELDKINHVIRNIIRINETIPARILDETILKRELTKQLKFGDAYLRTIILNENHAGVLLLLSHSANVFNEVVHTVISKMIINFPQIYNEKRFHHTLAGMVRTDKAVTDLGVNMLPIIGMIENYFQSPYVNIWLNDNKGHYVQQYNHIDDEKKENAPSIKIDHASINLDGEYTLIHFDQNEAPKESDYFGRFAKSTKSRTVILKTLRNQQHILGFISIFLKNSPLSDNFLPYEEVSFLNLASIKAMATIQINSLVTAFQQISDTFTKNDLAATLQTVTNKALEVLNADPVILFKSNNGEDVYFKDATHSQTDDFHEEKILEKFKDKDLQHVELAEIVLRTDNIFLNNHNDYVNFISKHSKKYEKKLFNEDFWTREGIKSMAAVKLVNKLTKSERPVGVLFINFRNDVVFNEDIQKLILTFAAFASSGIVNGLILDKNRGFLLDNLRFTRPLFQEQITAVNLHDTKKIYSSIYAAFSSLMRKVNSTNESNDNKIKLVKDKLFDINHAFDDLSKKFKLIESIYKPDQSAIIAPTNIQKLIDAQLKILESELESKGIFPKKVYLDEEVIIDCDEGQVGMAILNIINNAYEAMGFRGNLEIRVKKTQPDKIKIDIIDDGKGISPDIKPYIFEAYVTDKPSGSGLGLSLSKFIIETSHKGTLRYDTKNKLTAFTIILPIHNQKAINTQL